MGLDDADAQAPLGNRPPQVARQKLVVAHFMVGNTYPYQVADWTKASSKGIDAFALNVGRDSWQPARVADAFTAAVNSKTNFKLFLSFDMSSLPCAAAADAITLRNYLTTYRAHPHQMMYPPGSSRLLASTFAGEACRFGQGTLQAAWHYALRGDLRLPGVHFVPSFFMDPAAFGGLQTIDGSFQWNSAWPMGNSTTNFDADNIYLKNLGGRTYMAGVSPWFFTHYGPDTYNKNFIYRCDDWHFAARWEVLVKHRAEVDLAQVITWNDFGESHYVGPIAGAQPMSEAWTKGFDHQGWLDLMQYYIKAYKTGAYPAITRERVFLWGRLYPANANAPDHVGKPQNWAYTQDYLWGVVLLPSPAMVTLSCGSSTVTSALPAGLSKMRLRLTTDCNVHVKIWKKKAVVLDFAPKGFRFTKHPRIYNFNAFVAASP
ncbi:hypothetical protein D9615_005563 [Tricholomella constricta]|uniref:Glycoside hydrolase family 71 protein n=1 Tax=Tricholomella constricta TaxID=117010 RepID=A0A8H5HE32_9AGAR|nr:hypothetical protein D9615_005563 [Tricholomella constricta]